MPSNYATIGQSMICPSVVYVGRFLRYMMWVHYIARYNELRHPEAELLSTVCVMSRPNLSYKISVEILNRGSNRAPKARLDIHARGFWDHQRSIFFDVSVCHPSRSTDCMKMRNALVLEESARHRTWDIHTSCLYNNWWHGKRTFEALQPTC